MKPKYRYSSETVTRFLGSLGYYDANDRARILFVAVSMLACCLILMFFVGLWFGMWWLIDHVVDLARSWSTRAGRL